MADDQIFVNYRPAAWTVTQAPDEVRISLLMFQQSDKEALVLHGADLFSVGTVNPVEYEITGWDTVNKALTARRVS